MNPKYYSLLKAGKVFAVQSYAGSLGLSGTSPPMPGLFVDNINGTIALSPGSGIAVGCSSATSAIQIGGALSLTWLEIPN